MKTADPVHRRNFGHRIFSSLRMEQCASSQSMELNIIVSFDGPTGSVE